MTATWPETPSDRQARKAQLRKQRTAARKPLPAVDTRTPSGKVLPY